MGSGVIGSGGETATEDSRPGDALAGESPDLTALVRTAADAREREAEARRLQWASRRREISQRGARLRPSTRRGRLLALAGVSVFALVVAGGGAYVLGRWQGMPDSPMADSQTADSSTPDSLMAAQDTDSASLTREQRREVERLLAALKFPTGAVDGRIDPQTREAIRAYRRMQGLPAESGTAESGRATPALLADLRQVVGFMADPVDE